MPPKSLLELSEPALLLAMKLLSLSFCLRILHPISLLLDATLHITEQTLLTRWRMAFVFYSKAASAKKTLTKTPASTV